ncbi:MULTISPECIES: RND family transporter [unclassified Anaeromyxobacter]|uniref:efflux RND transporter permease subunit n=1 Tax=unclassified Anaeromyxobacter TaxID=2620896 RepID=UPI001F5A19D5|nr:MULTISPECIES: MMPL family transporter [unclassified Anaeromyxobacter]
MSPRLLRVFTRIVALRAPILAAYALLAAVAVALAVGIRSDAGISGLIVPSDPDYVATRQFEAIFPERPIVLLLLEADDPWRPEVLAETLALEDALRAIPGVTPVSALDVYRRAHPGFAPTPAGAAAFRAFATGTSFFRRQGLVGDGFQGLAVALDAADPARRDALLAAVDAAVDRAPRDAAVRGVRRVGAPWVEAWIEQASREASLRWFPVFGLFVVALVLFLYRSWRTLVAVVVALGTAVALAVAAGRLLGFTFTVVSALVPLTVMVTTLANLVYVQSRFVDQPEDVDVDAHQLFALANKFLPVTASTLAAVLGFAALAVSRIRPIREMGLWTATGLALSWVTVFTLFPALQKALRTPTGRAVPVRSRLYDRLAGALPFFTWRLRWVLVPGALALAAIGLVAITGVPGRLAPMRVGVDSLDYVDASLPIHRDIVYYRDHVGGLNVARVWVRTRGAVTDPEVLHALDRFASAAERERDVTSVVGPTTFLRMRRYLASGDDTLPADPQAFAALAGDVEQLLLAEPELRAFIDAGSLSNAQLTVVFRGTEERDFRALEAALAADWTRAAGGTPALEGASMRVVGESLLQAKVGASLVPTLAESFAITAALIFVVFLFVFRSAAARLMAMIPSVFAILVTFLGMRLTGTPLNVATILIATTVLGTTENDQIHFFHHLHEGEGEGGLDGALRHALRVSGRPIAFATLINAAGFLGLSFSSFPPIRQFGVVTAAAFLLAMLADFSALPAALWLARRERPRTGSAQPATALPRATRR